MSTVRWVEPDFLLTEDDKAKYQPIRQRAMIALVPLADLKDVVEGLKYIEGMLCERTLCGHFTPEEIRQVTQRLLAQLAPEVKKGDGDE